MRARAWSGCVAAGCLVVLASSSAADALPPKPAAVSAKWSGENWGIVRVLPMIARYGDQIHLHGMVVGPAPVMLPWWSCSQYEAWVANGTSEISLAVPGSWGMPHTGIDYFGNKVNVMRKDGGDPPPYGWENRISDTCYCVVTGFGAQGGCESREVQPDLFRMMDQFNPREGNVQFAVVTSRSGWTPVQVLFSGRAGVNWSDRATDYVYVVSDDSQLAEDSDHDDLSDAWEYAHSPTQSLDDFSGGAVSRSASGLARSVRSWVSPYAPREPGWVSAGPNDWDGDGISNKDEYLKWLSGITDGAGLPHDPTVINLPPIDPFLCYGVKTSKGTTKFAAIPGVNLEDAYEAGAVDLKKLRQLCTPAGLDGSSALDAVTHLASYAIKPAKGAAKHQKRTGVVVANQLGTLTVDTKKPEVLLVPTAKDLTASPAPPSPGLVDHFKCYPVKISKGATKFSKGLQVALGDQFTAPPKVYDLKKPLRICNPVDKNGGGTIQPASGVICYQAKLAKLMPKQAKHRTQLGVRINNGFGPLSVDTVKEEAVCLPADIARP